MKAAAVDRMYRQMKVDRLASRVGALAAIEV
jgi:hypothetical protein